MAQQPYYQVNITPPGESRRVFACCAFEALQTLGIEVDTVHYDHKLGVIVASASDGDVIVTFDRHGAWRSDA